jgi:uncharacterized protein (DUF1499 family)
MLCIGYAKSAPDEGLRCPCWATPHPSTMLRIAATLSHKGFPQGERGRSTPRAARPQSTLEFAACPWSQTGQFTGWGALRPAKFQPGRIEAMARRFSAPYQTEPVSSLASWARNLAVFSVIAVLVSILIVRFGFLEVKPALATFFGALACAGLSILVSLAAFVALWQNGSRGMGRILVALLIDAVVLAYPAYLALQYRKLPQIHDITTDPIDPPRFDALARLRSGDGANTAVYAGLYSAEQQRRAYPDIEPVDLEIPVQRAYDITLQLVNRRKWLVIDERPPQPPRRIGRIEAVARTPIMGFREDVSIRVAPDGDDSRVDIRSSSRYFESDLGSNAARIAKLIDDLNSAAENAALKPAKKPQLPVKLPPKTVKK